MYQHLGVDTMRLWGTENSFFQNQANNQKC